MAALPSLAHVTTSARERQRQQLQPRPEVSSDRAKLSGVGLQARQRKYFDALCERQRELERNHGEALQQVRKLEFETRSLRTGEVHPQTFVDQLAAHADGVEGERLIATSQARSLERQLDDSTSKLIEVESELNQARRSEARLREELALAVDERDRLQKLAEAEERGAEMEPEEAQGAPLSLSLPSP